MADQNTQSIEHSEGNPLSMSSDTLRDVLTSQELYEAFSRNLKAFREARGFNSPNALAVATNQSPNTIRAWERLGQKGKGKRGGRTYPRLDKLEVVAEKLNCEIWELFHPDIERLRKDLAELRRVREAIEPDDT